MPHVFTCWPVTAEVRVQTQASVYGICGGHSDSGRGFFRAHPLSPVSNLLPTLHYYYLFIYLLIDSFIYHRSCIRQYKLYGRPSKAALEKATYATVMY